MEYRSRVFPKCRGKSNFDNALRSKEFLKFFSESLVEFLLVALQRFFIFGVPVKEDALAFDVSNKTRKTSNGATDETALQRLNVVY